MSGDAAIRETASLEDLRGIEALAREIWEEHYTPIIGAEQVAYMLDNLQSAEAMDRQIRLEKFTYYLIEQAGRRVGYLGLQDQTPVLLLSKLYILSSCRGRGLAGQAMDFTKELARNRGCSVIRLTVNINNALAMQVYERMGFRRTGTKVADIGGGFIMDDFVYELPL